MTPRNYDPKNLQTKLKQSLVRSIFNCYDRVIFYTEQAKTAAIRFGLVSEEKAFYANNTLDTEDIWKNYTFEINECKEKTILFIGRLVPTKNIDLLISYFHKLKLMQSDFRLIIIGDGPESRKIAIAASQDKKILWQGAIVDEKLIAQNMKKAHLVFVPGNSGLSVVHAFCYGKPYVTLSTYSNHPPEIDYLIDNVNGLFLSGKLDQDCTRIVELLLNEERYCNMCHAAFETARELSVQAWCNKIKDALTF